MDELLQKIETTFHWDDLVLPPRSIALLHEVATSFKNRPIVFTNWGIGEKRALGMGISALFAGPSGTGKTLAAQVLASELDLNLYRIDLAAVVSKYIGETEKNLDQALSTIQDDRAILFFDEADALFGTRSEVKDANDRYANIETAYLLQTLEDHDGIAIVATNLRHQLDDAFIRRLRYVVDFPLPDAEHRTRIWEQVFPAQAPLGADIDFRFLGNQVEMTGGNIRNAALTAAFIATEDAGFIEMKHVVRATAREIAKMGRAPSESDFQDFYDLIRGEH